MDNEIVIDEAIDIDKQKEEEIAFYNQKKNDFNKKMLLEYKKSSFDDEPIEIKRGISKKQIEYVIQVLESNDHKKYPKIYQ